MSLFSLGHVKYLVLLCKLEREVLTCLLVSDLIDDQVSCVQVNLCGSAFFDGDTQLQGETKFSSVNGLEQRQTSRKTSD